MGAFKRNATDFAGLDVGADRCIHINNGGLILASCGTLTALACLTLIARVYTRGWMTHSTDWDDYTMWVAVGLSVVGFAIIVPEVYSGAGKYGTCLPPEYLRRSLLLEFIGQLLYVLSILFVKVSITLCLLRFAPSKAFSRFLWGCMIFFIATALMYFTSLMLQCRPLSMRWDPSIKDGKCMTEFSTRVFGYTNDAISLFVDLLLATLPIAMVWNIQVALHVKIAIALVMSMGGLAAAACAFRIHYLSPSTLTGDILFDSIVLTIWTAMECNIAIIAASVPSILPLIKRCHELTRKGRIQITIGRSVTATGDIDHGSKSSPGIKPGTQRKGSMQQDLLFNSEQIVSGKDMIPSIMIEEESPVDTDDDDFSQMYADASRSITKRSANGSQHSGVSDLQIIEESLEK